MLCQMNTCREICSCWHWFKRENLYMPPTLHQPQLSRCIPKEQLGPHHVNFQHPQGQGNYFPRWLDLIYVYIYIYTLGAGGSPKVLWVGFCEWLKIVISLWRNVSFWRSHSLHRIVFCADEIFLIRVLIDQKSIIHTFIFVRNVWFVW